MTANNNSTKIRHLRQQLLHNGFKPLPASQKGVHIKGWSRATIDQAFLKTHARKATHSNTGLRCDDLIAIDIDCRDAELADELEALTEQALGATEWCRVGQAPKRLLLYRLEGEVGRSARTGKYGGHMVELLCGPGRQFIAYGLHPGTGKPYHWEGVLEPATHSFDELPGVTYEAAIGLIDTIEETLAASGLPRSRSAHRQGLGAEAEYDLTDAFEFLTNEGELVTWGALKAELTHEGIFGNIRRENGEFGDSDAVHAYIARGSGQPCLYDFVRDTTHFESLGTEKLGEMLPPAPSANADRFTDDKLAELLRDWVHFPDKTMRHIKHPERPYEVGGMNEFFSEHTVPSPSGQGRPQTVVNAWKRHPERKKANYAELRPDYPDEAFVHQGDELIFNTYRRPQHPVDGVHGELDTFFEYLAHLIPEQRERAIFLDWNAYKIKYPSARMHGLIMVTPEFGTGRDLYFQILRRVIGAGYVKSIYLNDLLGSGSQSQYNEYLSEALVLTVSEALEERDDRSRWHTRHVAYEQFKKICSPQPEPMRVKRKYGKIDTVQVFASLLIASNHTDALAIPPGDRRLIIIDNTLTKLADAPNDLLERIVAWMGNPDNIGALYDYYMARAERIQYDPFGTPPMTPAKEHMIEASQSNIDQLYEIFLEQAKGDVCTAAQWRSYAQQAARDYDLPMPDSIEARDKALIAVLTARSCAAPGLPKCGLKIDKKMVRPRIIRNVKAWRDLSMGEAPYRKLLREEMRKNGPIGNDVISIM